MPDTFFFKKENQLAYISQETGSELFEYQFKSDTLIYVYYESEYDNFLEKEINYKYVSKLLFKNNEFQYLYYDKINVETKDSVRTSLIKEKLYFRKVK